ncbi:MAG: NADH-quinone oxidoreductase subunit C [Candidatus Bathyarchaeia archaeon]|jgi:NADH-quinone oxidoreductase subunit C
MSEVFLRRVEECAVDAKSKSTQLRENETLVEVEQEYVKQFVSKVWNDGISRHLSTITGLDLGEKIGIVYHFWQNQNLLHVRTTVQKTSPTAVSIVDIIPGAILYEMEIHDLFGVMFVGNPWMDKKLLLPETWPDDLPPPLLKTSKSPEIRKRLKLEVE